ncbi:MAG: DUF2442 domain-containing protein [Haliscomenobacter sp.]|uniref:DUF2442 domain-containing protein n=1 Tax=Haliscomenobacter sp. TaxID=2717303 RepID=UPI0029B636AE|nr:DUF2442 domain-containing protein [Haliscomenobacter sp.]MDX2071232.1 DUF2442 domain-containing protein [Haliscomenobacter sp.]
MESYPRINYLQTLPNYRLFLIFDNGEIKIYSLSERLESPAFAPLKDEALFNTARLANGGYGVIWNDELDLSEYELWVNGVEVSKISALVAKVA